jgi:Rrf2 family protein
MRLEVTRRSDLAARALVLLGRTGARMKAGELAEALGTTAGFVPQVLSSLVAAGWVRSDPGPTGGYSLTSSLDDISILQVVESVEGPTDTGRCVLADRPCNASGPCALHHPWTAARNHLLDELAGTPVSSLLATGRVR